MPSTLTGIAGGSASGKSSFTRELVVALSTAPAVSTALISTDAYFLPHDHIPRFLSPTRGVSLPDYNRPDSIDLPRLLADLDARMAAGSAPQVLIIEGLMVLHHPEIRERLDLRLYIELDADQRALRRLVRNIGTQNDPLEGISTPETIANYFLESAKIGHERFVEPSRKFADLILRGDGDFERSARMVSAVIRSMM